MIYKGSTLITDIVSNVSPKLFERITVVNDLLDGSRHIQNIGSPRYFFTFDMVCTSPQVDSINGGIAINELFSFVRDGIEYKGFLSVDSWKKLTKDYSDKTKVYYIAEDVRLDVTEEGSI